MYVEHTSLSAENSDQMVTTGYVGCAVPTTLLDVLTASIATLQNTLVSSTVNYPK